jgi:predicted transcriptional regulator
MEFHMQNPKHLHATTVRLEPEVWQRVELLAPADRRRPAEFLKLVISDAIADQSSRGAAAGSAAGMVTA